MAGSNKKFAPVSQVGIKGLQTFNDPQFIDDNAFADMLNVDIDQAQVQVRAGTEVLYGLPSGETGTPEQMFRFLSVQGTEFIMVKFSDNWYVRTVDSTDWILIGTTNQSSPIYNGTSWSSAYYSNALFAGGLGNNLAFFAPSDFNTNPVNSILMWPLGVTTLSRAGSIGDQFVVVEDTNQIYMPTNGSNGSIIIGGTNYIIQAKDRFYVTGVTTNLSAVVTGLSRTDIIQAGQQVSGSGIPSFTTVVSVDSPSQITLSHNATSSSGTSFTANGTLSTGSNVITSVNNVGGTIIVGMGVTGTGIPVGATVVSVGNGDGSGATGIGDTTSSSTTISNFSTTSGTVTVGMTVTGAGIAAGTVVTNVSATLIQLSADATATASGISLTFTANATTVTITSLATSDETNEAITFSGATNTLFFKEDGFLLLLTNLTSNEPIGTLVANEIVTAPIPYSGSVVAIFNQKLWIADGSQLAYSDAGDPLSYSTIFTSGSDFLPDGIINDLQNFGQVMLVAQENTLQTVQVGIATDSAGSASEYLVILPYITGQGMGATSPQSTIQYNNQYYYPTTTNGILALSPSFTGSSSSSGVTVLSDQIHNLYLTFTFLRGLAWNRKLYWLVQTPATTSTAAQTYVLVYSFLRGAFTLYQYPIVDFALFDDGLVLFGTDGSTYTADVSDSYEDYNGTISLDYNAYALTKRWDYGDPTSPKVGQYCMVQGTISTGTTLTVEVFYNEAGSLSKVPYKIVGDPTKPYINKQDPSYSPGSPVLASLPFGYADGSLLNYRVYLDLDQSMGFHTFQLKFSTDKAGSFWSAGIIAPNVEATPVPPQLVISPS